MKMVRITSLIARSAFMAAMVFGLLFWIAQIPGLSMFLRLLLQIRVTGIHEVLGIIGAFTFFLLALIAAWTRKLRPLGVLSIVYALLVVAFGLTQSRLLVGNLHWLIQIVHLLVGIGAMYLALGIERRYRSLKQSAAGFGDPKTPALQTV